MSGVSEVGFRVYGWLRSEEIGVVFGKLVNYSFRGGGNSAPGIRVIPIICDMERANILIAESRFEESIETFRGYLLT